MAAGLWFVGEGDWATASLVYVLAAAGFSGAIVFYDALIVSVSAPDKYDEVSAFGFSLGYIGGGLLFALNVAMTLWPEAFGLSGSAEAVRLSFVTVAVWWLSSPFRCSVWCRSHRAWAPQAMSTAVAARCSAEAGERQVKSAGAAMSGAVVGAALLSADHTGLPRPSHGRPVPAGLLLLYRRRPHHHAHGGWTTACPSACPPKASSSPCSSRSSWAFPPPSHSAWRPTASARSPCSTSVWRSMSASPFTPTFCPQHWSSTS